MSRTAFALIAALWITWASAGAAPDSANVAAVGCASDGQNGPVPAQTIDDVPKLIGVDTSKLAYYEANGVGVLAPIGWNCFGLYGSNGSILIVTPERHGDDLLTSGQGLKGRAIQLTVSFGETSGRLEAAKIAARLFPSRRQFVESVIAEKIEPRGSFHFGPFPTDTIYRFGNNIVEFGTPPKTKGMGTTSRLVPNGDPIRGLAMITPDNIVSLLVVRLPESQRHLTTTIIKTVRESEKPVDPD